MGINRHYRQRHRPDGVSLSAHRLDVRRRRPCANDTRRFSGARTQGTARRARRSRGTVVVPGLEGVGFLYRPHSLCRRRLYGGMMMMTPQRISILGGGLMGHGIALVFAAAGHDVKVTDPIAEVRERLVDRIGATLDELGNGRKALEHIAVVKSLEACVADAQWVIEAAPEDLALKQRIFADV